MLNIILNKLFIKYRKLNYIALILCLWMLYGKFHMCIHIYISVFVCIKLYIVIYICIKLVYGQTLAEPSNAAHFTFVIL